MDYISSVFELDQTDEVVRLCSIPSQQQIIPEAEPCEVKDESPRDIKKKKLNNHRENERQRRQEMTTLYASLRSNLPFDYLKGKRTISDHIQEAVKYIKHLEEKIQMLNDKKDVLRKLSNNSNSSNPGDEMLECSERDALTVKRCLVGVEVVIDTSLRKSFPPSQVFQVLIEVGVSIVSCSSSKVRERMFHVIKSEASDGRCIDVSALEQRLKKSMIQL